MTCDHYHRYKEDIGLMKAIGLQAYRLSISWSRVLPEGNGMPNPKGLDLYDRLVDELFAAGITPYSGESSPDSIFMAGHARCVALGTTFSMGTLSFSDLHH